MNMSPANVVSLFFCFLNFNHFFFDLECFLFSRSNRSLGMLDKEISKKLTVNMSQLIADFPKLDIEFRNRAVGVILFADDVHQAPIICAAIFYQFYLSQNLAQLSPLPVNISILLLKLEAQVSLLNRFFLFLSDVFFASSRSANSPRRAASFSPAVPGAF